MKNIALLSLFSFCLGTTSLQACDDLFEDDLGSVGHTISEEALEKIVNGELDINDLISGKVEDPGKQRALPELAALSLEERQSKKERETLAILSPKEIESQKDRIRFLRKKLFESNENLSDAERKEHSYFNIAARPFISRIGEMYSYIVDKPNLKHVRNALIAFGTKLQEGTDVKNNLLEGLATTEWPEKEQSLWSEIQGLVRNSKSYGKEKAAIQVFEEKLIALKKECDVLDYLPFIFNPNLKDQDASLIPFITLSTKELVNLIDDISRKGEANEPPQELELLQELAFWKNMQNLLLNGIHQAQNCGWAYSTRYLIQAGLGQTHERMEHINDKLNPIERE